MLVPFLLLQIAGLYGSATIQLSGVDRFAGLVEEIQAVFNSLLVPPAYSSGGIYSEDFVVQNPLAYLFGALFLLWVGSSGASVTGELVGLYAILAVETPLVEILLVSFLFSSKLLRMWVGAFKALLRREEEGDKIRGGE